MIHICDAIMGSGKTSAAIQYMNERPNQKFIFITPYLDEADRICKACPSLKFKEPSTKYVTRNHTKSADLIRLIESGRNIATTHSLFSRMKEDTLNKIKSNEYTLFIDEAIGVLDVLDFAQCDVDAAVQMGYIEKNDNGSYVRTNKEYNGTVFTKLLKEFESHDMSSDNNGVEKIQYYYWLLPPEFISSFKDVFVLTYLFEAQDMRMLLEMNNIPYDKIHIVHDPSGGYHFNESYGTMPDYTEHLSDKIHIIGSDYLNKFGDDDNAMSMAWYSKAGSSEVVRKHLSYLYHKCMTDYTDNPKLMWGAYKEQFNRLSGTGYKTKYVVFNERATNKYADRNILAYLVNIYPNKVLRSFCTKNGVELDWDAYALSTMVQWIWRSAIRKGEDVWLYIPSARMRNILTNWIADVMHQYQVQNGGDQNAAS